MKWALSFPEVKAVQAQTEPNNAISQKVILHNGFQHVGQGAEGPLFEIRKPVNISLEMLGSDII